MAFFLSDSDSCGDAALKFEQRKDGMNHGWMNIVEINR